MKNFIFVLSLVVGAWMLSPTPVAQASWWSSWSWGGGDGDHRQWGGDSDSGRKGGGHGVPELDPSAAGGAMVLLLGGVAYIASRRREEDLG
jgi:hypothetical protein